MKADTHNIFNKLISMISFKQNNKQKIKINENKNKNSSTNSA